jgi:hypothetical protein
MPDHQTFHERLFIIVALAAMQIQDLAQMRCGDYIEHKLRAVRKTYARTAFFSV